MSFTDHYATLQIARDADQAAIKASYRRLAKLHHPDKNLNDPLSTARFQAIEAAYSTLSDVLKRIAYDAQYSTFRGTHHWWNSAPRDASSSASQPNGNDGGAGEQRKEREEEIRKAAEERLQKAREEEQQQRAEKEERRKAREEEMRKEREEEIRKAAEERLRTSQDEEIRKVLGEELLREAEEQRRKAQVEQQRKGEKKDQDQHKWKKNEQDQRKGKMNKQRDMDGPWRTQWPRTGTTRWTGGCQHQGWWEKQTGGGAVCETCEVVVRHFIFRCPGCRTMACVLCRNKLKKRRWG
ncbi:hypothetical protein ACRALDRAFT_1061854 [Sodiomyces alcalophilus JCM 7366]|uniref:uncharacterized protein n=1 Tax=Sodiomyces alcalophilus JCM 7366 TaxID=591952 RepID=UPI0039B3D1E6